MKGTNVLVLSPEAVAEAFEQYIASSMTYGTAVRVSNVEFDEGVASVEFTAKERPRS